MLEAGSVGDLNDSTAMRHDRPLTLKTAYWFALIILLSSCSHDYELMKMEEQVSGYGSAIRWNLFKKAVTYLDPPPLKTPDWNSLAQVKVTSYLQDNHPKHLNLKGFLHLVGEDISLTTWEDFSLLTDQ